MSISHYLFWKKGDSIAAIGYNSSRYEIVKPKGELFVPLTSDYWQEWEDYAGYCTGDDVDFCMVSPMAESLDIPERYRNCICQAKDACWTAEKVRDCAELLLESGYMEVYAREPMFSEEQEANQGKEKLRYLLRYNQIRGCEAEKLVAVYREPHSCKEAKAAEQAGYTPFIEYFVKELGKSGYN